LQAIAGFYAYFCVLFEWGLEPKHIVGMDKHFIFAPPKIKKLFEFGYFLWCFTDSSMECVYTPKTFTCDMIEWKESAWEPFASGGDWYPSNWQALEDAGVSVDGVAAGDLSTCWTNEGVCNANPQCLTVNKAMFSSMVCQWANGIGNERCTWTQALLAASEGIDTANLPTMNAGTAGGIVYESKGTKDGVYLDTSERFSNRYCQPEDYHIVKEMSGGDNNWADGVDGDDFAAVNTIMKRRFAPGELDRYNVPLCDAQGEKITNGGGHPASIYPYQMHDRVNALRNSNTAYFISIIIVQWGDLMICKTRSRSLFEQGMTNVFMNWSLMFETILGAFLCYVSVCNDAMQTLPIDFVWWTPAIPFSLAIYSYDELRKGVIRAYPDGWLRYNTYW